MEWGWPQWVFAAILLAKFVLLIARDAKGDWSDRLGVVIGTIIGIGATVYILHAGGFW